MSNHIKTNFSVKERWRVTIANPTGDVVGMFDREATAKTAAKQADSSRVDVSPVYVISAHVFDRSNERVLELATAPTPEDAELKRIAFTSIAAL